MTSLTFAAVVMTLSGVPRPSQIRSTTSTRDSPCIRASGSPRRRLIEDGKAEELHDWEETHDNSHKQVRARVGHTLARMKTWKILRDCPLKSDSVHHAMLGIARLHNLNLAG